MYHRQSLKYMFVDATTGNPNNKGIFIGFDSDDDVVNVKAVIRLRNIKYNKSLENPLSGEYQALANRLTNAVRSLTSFFLSELKLR